MSLHDNTDKTMTKGPLSSVVPSIRHCLHAIFSKQTIKLQFIQFIPLNTLNPSYYHVKFRRIFKFMYLIIYS